jgi:hypothetical protein
MRSEEILAAEMSDDSLLDLVSVTEGLDQPQVFVAAVGGFDGAKEHEAPPQTLHNKRQ